MYAQLALCILQCQRHQQQTLRLTRCSDIKSQWIVSGLFEDKFIICTTRRHKLHRECCDTDTQLVIFLFFQIAYICHRSLVIHIPARPPSHLSRLTFANHFKVIFSCFKRNNWHIKYDAIKWNSSKGNELIMKCNVSAHCEQSKWYTTCVYHQYGI